MTGRAVSHIRNTARFVLHTFDRVGPGLIRTPDEGLGNTGRSSGGSTSGHRPIHVDPGLPPALVTRARAIGSRAILVCLFGFREREYSPRVGMSQGKRMALRPHLRYPAHQPAISRVSLPLRPAWYAAGHSLSTPSAQPRSIVGTLVHDAAGPAVVIR